MTIFEMIMAEQQRQTEKFGHRPTQSDYIWMAILTEEVGESAQAVLQEKREELIGELVQVAAVAVTWLEHLT